MLTSTHDSLSLLALSHTPVEHRLYETLRDAAGPPADRDGGGDVRTFSLRRLLALTGLNSYSTLRRARAGLVSKLSIDCKRAEGDDGTREHPGSFYLVYAPEEIFERRRQAGQEPYPREYSSHALGVGYTSALERVVSGYNLSRREAQVALCCAEGLTNAEIGDKLSVTEQTVKFHLRHIYVKFGVRRRGELISRLLRHEESPVAGATPGTFHT